MTILLQIIFWACGLALAHTYIIYPLLMRWLAAGKKANDVVFDENSPDLPRISVVMSVFNEEKVIRQKLESLAKIEYPAAKLHFFVGSDCSSDDTNAICKEAGAEIQNFNFHAFEKRRGKPSVVNDLADSVFSKSPPGENHVLLLTDASVLLRPDTVFQLVKHFKNTKIGVVDAHMTATGMREEGISRSENRYMNAETRLKHDESRAWGTMVGPFGGCYAIRSDLFSKVPPNHLVDDFYIVFRVLERGFKAINELNAICYEGATHFVSDEYRRKKRIAAGSFQNLSVFRGWVLPPFSRLGFAFFSHKVLRWFGGFFIGTAFLAAFFLRRENAFQGLVFWSMLFAILGAPFLNWLCNQLKINVLPLRNFTYFLAMNAALTEGFFKFLRGIREGTWQRTNRY